MERWPNFFIVGAPKAGTSSIYEYLKTFPEIFMSSIKEPNYFSGKTVPDDYKWMKPIRDKEQYLTLFSKVQNESIFGEASATYFYDPEAPKLIYEKFPNAKILVSLRDPVERAFSHYLKNIKNKSKISFHEQILKEISNQEDPDEPILVVKNGLYSESLKRYQKFFGGDVFVIIFEEFVKNPGNIINNIISFLGIKNSTGDFEKRIYNKYVPTRGTLAEYLIRTRTTAKLSKILPQNFQKFLSKNFLYDENKPKPKMSKNDRELLINYYKEDVKKLRIILKRKFHWENFPEINI